VSAEVSASEPDVAVVAVFPAREAAPIQVASKPVFGNKHERIELSEDVAAYSVGQMSSEFRTGPGEAGTIVFNGPEGASQRAVAIISMRWPSCGGDKMTVAMTAAVIRHLILIVAFTLATSARAERFEADYSVVFFVNPSGDDSRDCRSEAAPCRTMQQAYRRARREYDFAKGGCTIKLADGVYTDGLTTTGTLVGTHLCQVIGNPANREAVIVQPPPGSAAFDIQDLAMISVMDLTIQGERIIGFYGRQFVIVDIARIKFGPMPDGIAVSMDHQAGANLVGHFSIDGEMVAFLTANRLSRFHVAGGVSISVKKPVNIHYFVMSYQNSLVEFGGEVQLKNSQFISGQQYRAYQHGIINTNGLVLPGTIAGQAALGGQAY